MSDFDVAKDFELALSELIDTYRNKVAKDYVSKTLEAAVEIVEKDEGWVFSADRLAPTFDQMTPATAVAGAPDDITLQVIGTNFTEGSVIVFNAVEEPTTFVSATELTTIVKPSLFTAPAAVPCLARTAGIDTEPLDFTFTAAE